MAKPASKLSVDALRDVSSAALRFASLAESVLREGKLHQDDGVTGVVRAMLDEARRSLPMTMDDPLGLTFVRDALRPQVLEKTRREYSTERPWPQPHPLDPDRLALTVMNVPMAEVQEFLEKVVARYVRTLRALPPKAAMEAWRLRTLEPVSDRELGRVLRDTVLCRFVNERLTAEDERAFASVTSGREGRFFVADLSALSIMKTYPGMYVAATVTLLEQERDGGPLVPRAIRVPGGAVLTPADGDGWELAKHFVLQGAGLCLVVGVHPTVHFPVDAINALTKTLLSEGHPVRQAIEPHCYLQLPLNFAVLHIGRSVAHNDQREIYTGFPFDKHGFFGLAAHFQAGVEGHPSYPTYRYPLEAPRVPFKYGEFLSRYFDAILSFTTSVAACVQPGDPEVARWARHLSALVPGFPGEEEIFTGDTLARAVATFIHDVTVVHAADHHDYAGLPLNVVPLRLRQPPPTGPLAEPLDRSQLVTWEDMFRQFMCHQMYFKPTNVRRLVEVRYEFKEPVLRARSREFLASLVQVDRAVSSFRFIPLEEISCSIQY